MSFGRGIARITPTNDFGDRRGGGNAAASGFGSGANTGSGFRGGFDRNDNQREAEDFGSGAPRAGGDFNRGPSGFGSGANAVDIGGGGGGGSMFSGGASFGRGGGGTAPSGGFGSRVAPTSDASASCGDFGGFDSNSNNTGSGSFGGGRIGGGSFVDRAGSGGAQRSTGGFGARPAPASAYKDDWTTALAVKSGGFGTRNATRGRGTGSGSFGARCADFGFGGARSGGGFVSGSKVFAADRYDNGFDSRNDTAGGGFSVPKSDGFGGLRGGDDFGPSTDGGGGFGGGSDFNNGAVRPNNGYDGGVGPSHVPKQRTVDDIFEEDVNAAENYSNIRAEDDNIVITGPNTETIVVADTWEEANLEPALLANIVRAKYAAPRKIQSYSIPMIMEGYDVKGHAETGSGKTAAFLIPIINTIIRNKASGDYKSRRCHPFALIVEPTRELAIQLFEQARKLAHDTGVSVAVTYGKYRIPDNLREISSGCDILVGTPGRLRDFFQREYVPAEDLKVLVLDEADYLLEADFMVEIRKICTSPKFPDKENRQTLLFSATFSPNVQQWADEILRKQNVMISNQKFASANNRVVQNFLLVVEADKKDQLIKLLKEELEEKRAGVADGEEPRLRRTLVFVQRKRDADVLSTYLCQEGIKSTTINGDRTQEMREESLEQFRTYQVDLVVSTDVCARGIDIKDLDHVINFDLPAMSQARENYVTYIHRIGRTGRIKEGVATSFFEPTTDAGLAADLVAGVRDAGQVPPDFLIEAAENRLVVPVSASNEEDDAWGTNTKKLAGLTIDVGGTTPPKTTNDDW